MDKIPEQVKVFADFIVWGVAWVGWLGVLQPWLTAVATILAIVWTSIQILSWLKKRK